MNREKKIRLSFVGDGCPCLERDECVVVASVDYVGAQSLLQQLAQAQRYIQHYFLLFNATRSGGAGVVPPMARIDHDAADFQAKCTHQGALAGSGRVRFMRGRSRRIVLVWRARNYGMKRAWLLVTGDWLGRGSQGSIVGLGCGDGAGNGGSDWFGGGPIGGLHAVWLLAEGCDFLLARSWAARRTGHGGRLWRVDHHRRFADDGWCSSGRKARQVCGGRRTRLEAMDVDDQPPGIGKEKSRIVGN